jgi:uncharacterized protein (TIGR02598 family)
MKTPLHASRRLSSARAFTLVESVIAIGIFAFVIVGIIGLFPAGMKRQADAGAEARARVIAESIFEGIKASDFITEVRLPQQVDSKGDPLPKADITDGVLLGFSVDGTSVNYIWRDGVSAWDSGNNAPPEQNITTKARVQAVKVPEKPDLYQVIVDVGSPADLPADSMTVFTFTSYAYFQK